METIPEINKKELSDKEIEKLANDLVTNKELLLLAEEWVSLLINQYSSIRNVPDEKLEEVDVKGEFDLKLIRSVFEKYAEEQAEAKKVRKKLLKKYEKNGQGSIVDDLFSQRNKKQ